MPKICYVKHKFNKKTGAILKLANEIISDYAQQGFDLTLRQLYYQMVSRDVIPNNQSEYKKLGQAVSDARRAGIIDWDAIIDRTRNLKENSHWDSPADILYSAEVSFRVDKWSTQPRRIEVWVEKDALGGVIAKACSPLDVPHFACRGHNSDSEMWRAAQRFTNHEEQSQEVFLIHLGDHDPSGIDMTRDIETRLNLFGAYPTVTRIALNLDQIEEYAPPPNPAKETDSRWQGYVDEFGITDSYELDALEPQVIVDLITTEILAARDDELWSEKVDEENAGKAALKAMREGYKRNGK